MQTDINELEVNGIKYVRKGSAEAMPEVLGDMAIVRSESAGVFFGKIEEQNMATGVVKMRNARRLWYWDGAASLSQLAIDGTSKPKTCKFPTPVMSITIGKVIEIIPVTAAAAKSINEVAVWKI